MSNKFYLDSSTLFAKPSFMKGVVRVLDLFNTIDEYNYKETPAEADLEALKRDWTMVGLDIANAIEEHEADEQAGSNLNQTSA